MKRVAYFTAIALTFTSFGVLAYSESDETRYQDDWFAEELKRTDGYVKPGPNGAANGATDRSCPSPPPSSSALPNSGSSCNSRMA